MPPSAPGEVPASGAEVPILGSEKIKWIELTVPSHSLPSPPSPHPSPLPPSSSSSCHVISGDPPSYAIWRIHDDRPDVLEVVEFSPAKEFPESGIRIVFPEPLYPFSFICKKEEENAEGNKKMVYALTLSGIAYLLALSNPSSYLSGSVVPPNDLIVHDVRSHSPIMAVASAPGCLVVGRQDGSVSCYKLGSLHRTAPGFVSELRDDVGIGRLWNLMSRGRAVGPVQHISVLELFGRRLLFVAHLDGTLRVWDLISNTRLLNHLIAMQESLGITVDRFWVGDTNYETGQILYAVLFKSASEIVVCSLDFISGEKLTFSSESPFRRIPLHKGRLVDLKLSSSEIWILQDSGSTVYDLYCSDISMEHACRYVLQEDYISDQLFQLSGHSLEDLSWKILSVLPYIKDQVQYVISSIFLRRLLQPGIYLHSALSATVLELKKYSSEYEVRSLSVSELKQEILSIVESQGHAANPRSTLLFWKKLCSRYIKLWLQNNSPFSFYIDRFSGGICLIRKCSISSFRRLEYIESSRHGTFDVTCDARSSTMNLIGSDINNEILFELRKCLRIIFCHMGSAAAAVLYESLLDASIISSEDIIFNFVKELNAGCCSAEIGEVSYEKMLANHAVYRKFSVTMLASLHMLHMKATSWGRVLDVFHDYLKCFIPDNVGEYDESKGMLNANSCLLIHAGSHISKVMFDWAVNILIFLGFLVNIGPKIGLAQSEVSLIKLKIMPMVLGIIARWHVLHFVGTTVSELPSLEDFSSKLSSLHIDSNQEKRPFQAKLGTSSFTLAFLLCIPVSYDEVNFISSSCLPSPRKFSKPIWTFFSRVIWNETDEKKNSFFLRAMEISCILLQHGQYGAAEKLLMILDAHLNKRMVTFGVQDDGGEWSACLHLLGFCILMRAQVVDNGVLNEQKVCEAVRLFFRAASGERVLVALRNLSFQTGLLYPSSSASTSLWKFFYYQWAMQMFEQHNLSDAACQFALAALEQIDDVLADDNSSVDLPESSSTVRGRLWANIFKFSLDLNRYSDAYCAIISNPDEDSKSLCLRRFIIVLCERNEMQFLCDGGLPFVGLTEKVEKELIWKAERSDVSSKPNLYKVLYGFEMYCKNWRKAASYMYRYAVRVRLEGSLHERHGHFLSYEDVLCALSSSINALQLVNSSQAWIDSWHDHYFSPDYSSPNKRARKLVDNDAASITVSADSHKHDYVIDIEMLEKEYVLTLAQHLLNTVNVHCSISGDQAQVSKAVDALIQDNFYDVAFAVILKFFKGSKLRSELERSFITMSQKCCTNYLGGLQMRIDVPHNLLLTSSENEVGTNEKVDNMPFVSGSAGSLHWEMLEQYLEAYKKLHPRLPVVVAETLLFSNPQIELPLWLVDMFKGGRRATSWGMTGREADPATLFRLYINYGRHAEATNLLLEYIDAFASFRPMDAANRKKMSSIWFPYVAVERLQCHLEEVQSSGRMMDQCNKLMDLLCDALQNHFKQMKVDSEDAMFVIPA